jgi:hypothetical protein
MELERGVPREPDSYPDDFMPFGIRAADGSSWSNVDGPPTEDSRPIVTMEGGSGSPRHWRTNHWLWPLPPPDH